MFKKAFMIAGLLIAGAASTTTAEAALHHRRIGALHGSRIVQAAHRHAARWQTARRQIGHRFAAASRREPSRRWARGGTRPAQLRFARRQAPAVSRGSGFVQTGRASFYSGGGRTANGGTVGAATCAHRSLPFGTRVLVTNLANAHRAVLTVNDRGPFVGGRVVDVSRGAAGTLGMLGSGTAPVRVEVLGRAG